MQLNSLKTKFLAGFLPLFVGSFAVFFAISYYMSSSALFRDADELGIKNGEKVKVISRRGEITATARVGRKVSQGETWMPFHFPDSPANVLTNAALDDFARIPEYKVCAVRVEKIEE